MAPDDSILHQDDVEGVISEEIEEGVGKNQPAIEDVEDDVVDDVAAAGGTYVQAEVNAIRTAVNAHGVTINEHGGAINTILAALRANGIIDEE